MASADGSNNQENDGVSIQTPTQGRIIIIHIAGGETIPAIVVYHRGNGVVDAVAFQAPSIGAWDKPTFKAQGLPYKTRPDETGWKYPETSTERIQVRT